MAIWANQRANEKVRQGTNPDRQSSYAAQKWRDWSRSIDWSVGGREGEHREGVTDPHSISTRAATV